MYEWHNQDSRFTGPLDIGCTLNTNAGGREGHIVISASHGGFMIKPSYDIADTIQATDYKDPPIIDIDRETINCGQNFYRNLGVDERGIAHTIKAVGLGAVAYKQDIAAVDCRNDSEDPINGSLQADACRNIQSNNIVRVNNIVRRLTPTECERLQGYPDGWTDIGECIDSSGKKKKA